MTTNLQKLLVWQKAKPIPRLNPAKFRQDAHGNLIIWSRYGMNILGGWVIDHIKPISKEGSNFLRNRQPLQTRTNLQKGNTYPYRPRWR